MLSLNSSRLVPAVISLARRRRLLWPIWWASAVAALLSMTGGAYAWYVHQREGGLLSAELLRIGSAQTAAASPGGRAVDFTATLPTTTPIDKLLRDTFRTASSNGVTVVSAEPRETLAASPNGLASAALSLRLAGPYPGIKIVLSELLARFPGLTVQQLRIQRTPGNAAAQEASVTLQQWLRPTSVAQPSAIPGR